ncbi:phosphatidylserine decarboxylase proenzyme, mitochondrial isoform X2 [Anopheles ziemanni]|uniref:phosphatidylserine decarboxylase proenzyme, mitochondrial isoform X2 n=1 Tax=Anopheles coustani TaxID=139045 RepID=UPI00265AC02D|nr:phosphatidylserine decarboxylase proenzyme, mitochondrial isoform X2 [Anopheles coustani]XP_058173515.1 phosphatidylserine decarboxylase proenzyme, mitochondrial isoform X2 [Anopheles ziemanni]
MAVFMPKYRLFTRAVAFKPNPRQWSTRWAIYGSRQLTSASTNHHQQQQQQHQQHQQQHQQQQQYHQSTTAGGWLTWRGVFLRWTPIGICMVVAAKWHLHNRELDKKGLPRTAAKWQAKMYCSLPLRLMSRAFGWVADRKVPKPARPMVYGLYSNTFGVKMEEAAAADFKEYKSLGEFFTRPLKEDARPIDPKTCFVSPCDGRILHFGAASSNLIEQVKGVSYSLEAFLGPPSWCKKDATDMVEKVKKKASPDSVLYQCVIYLAPGDYHRFHSPALWKPELRRHFSGELLSVSPKIAGWIPGLFCLNERAVYIGKWKHGFFSYTAVGATNVGSVEIFMDEKLKTNKCKKKKTFDELELPNDKYLEKGELVGQFRMGSTIVLIFEAPKEFKFNLFPGQRVKVGEKLGTFEGIEEQEENPEEVKRVIESFCESEVTAL